MLARIHAAPNAADLPAVLQRVADLLYEVNVTWLRGLVARELDPPIHALHCAPPWCSRPMVYVPHRGAPLGTTRDYYDGATMFHRGSGTCIEIAAYDAAASTVIAGVNARPLVVGQLPSLHCIVRLADGSTTDPTTEVKPWRSSSL